MNRIVPLIVLSLAPALAGCAGSVQAVRGAVAAAPDWYDARAAEVRGEGYPRIGAIPTLDRQARSREALAAGRSEVARAEALFRMDPRAVPAGMELEEMMAWAEAARAEIEAAAQAPADHITDEEVAELKALFDRPRGRAAS